MPCRAGVGHPWGFSQLFQERRHLWHLFVHMFRTCENFRPRSLKVRSPGHVKWPQSLNFKRMISVTVSIRSLSRNFYIGDLRSGKFCDLSITCKSMGEHLKAPLLNENHAKHSQTSGYRRKLDNLNRKIETSCPSSYPLGQFRSWKVTSSF